MHQRVYRNFLKIPADTIERLIHEWGTRFQIEDDKQRLLKTQLQRALTYFSQYHDHFQVIQQECAPPTTTLPADLVGIVCTYAQDNRVDARILEALSWYLEQVKRCIAGEQADLTVKRIQEKLAELRLMIEQSA